jgi:L-threonylcarbamoyladenylate synthase
MIIKSIGENFGDLVTEAVDILAKGGLIIYPTETCYGVGVDATNEQAVSNLLKYKKRPPGKAISVGIYDENSAKELIEFGEAAQKIFNNFLPGPITLISKSKSKVDKRLESEKGTLGIRYSSNLFFWSICKSFGKPITTTSANSAGERTPYTVDHVLQGLSDRQKEKIDAIFDAGELPKNPPSTVVDISSDELKIYRSGGIDPQWLLLNKHLSRSEDETIALGERYAEVMRKDQVNLVLLSGDLGAGKTHFVKGLFKRLGVNSLIKSPTYNYYNEFLTEEKTLIHLDAWRIESQRELELLGIYDWLKNLQDYMIAIEWPSVLMQLDNDIFNTKFYFISFTNIDPQTRDIRVYKSNLN